MDWPRAIIHIDMDTFFVSVERKFDPSLIGKPVIVGGGPDGDRRRGVVAASSYETRAYGVYSAMPLGQALRLCPQAIVVPVGRSDYGAETRKVINVLGSFTDRFEMSSPDEAYVDLAGTEWLHGDPIQAASRLRERIFHEVGLPVSAGLATSKTVAKIGSKLSKPNGLFIAFPGGEARILRHLSLRAMPGLGPKTAEALKRRNIATLGDLVNYGEKNLIDLLGSHGASLYRRALGECHSQITIDEGRAQISTENTFPVDIGDPVKLHAELARMTSKVASRLRKSGCWAGTVTLKLRYPTFQTMTRQMVVDPPTHDDNLILAAADRLLAQTWDKRTPIRLLGVGVTGLLEVRQEDLFQVAQGERRERLLKTLDEVRARAGRDKLTWAATLGGAKSKSRRA